MGRTRHNDSGDQDMPKKRGRMTEAKTYNKPTLFKLVAQFKPNNMVLWSTIRVLLIRVELILSGR